MSENYSDHRNYITRTFIGPCLEETTGYCALYSKYLIFILEISLILHVYLFNSLSVASVALK